MGGKAEKLNIPSTWSRNFHRSSNLEKATDEFAETKTKPKKWSVGILNDRKTDEVPGESIRCRALRGLNILDWNKCWLYHSGQAQSFCCQTAETMNRWGYERRLRGNQRRPYHPLTPRGYDLLSQEMSPRGRRKRRRQLGTVQSSLCLSLMSRWTILWIGPRGGEMSLCSPLDSIVCLGVAWRPSWLPVSIMWLPLTKWLFHRLLSRLGCSWWVLVWALSLRRQRQYFLENALYILSASFYSYSAQFGVPYRRITPP